MDKCYFPSGVHHKGGSTAWASVEKSQMLKIHHKQIILHKKLNCRGMHERHTKELKDKAILSLKQYCMCCYVVLSNVF